MDCGEFIGVVERVLQDLTPERKDAWILEQARLVSMEVQQDFILSLTGEKKITYMPTEAEIEEFCQKVRDGGIVVEYEKHYYEFDDNGRYMDDWKSWHNDPQDAFPFLDRVFRGCRDLLRLGEAVLARKILDDVCRLEFEVTVSPDSEDVDANEYASLFTVADAGKEQKLSMQMHEIGHDWVTALLLDEREEGTVFARKLLEVLQNEICRQMNPSGFGGLISAVLLGDMEEILRREVTEIDRELQEISGEIKYWRRRHALEAERARKQHLLLDIRKKCRKQENEAEKAAHVSVLKASWKQIGELFRTLTYERYIDDQLEIIIFLLRDAGARGEKDRYKKFYASAKRRKRVDMARVNEAVG